MTTPKTADRTPKFSKLYWQFDIVGQIKSSGQFSYVLSENEREITDGPGKFDLVCSQLRSEPVKFTLAGRKAPIGARIFVLANPDNQNNADGRSANLEYLIVITCQETFRLTDEHPLSHGGSPDKTVTQYAEGTYNPRTRKGSFRVVLRFFPDDLEFLDPEGREKE